MLMSSLTGKNGAWRSGNVGIFDGNRVCQGAPPAKRVPALMEQLFEFLTQDTSFTWLIKACVFHYELEFIHPFTDGNGHMGRLWQQLLLMKEDPVFEYIPVEVLIKERQQEYYRSLGESDQKGDSTPFILFSLETILEAILAYGKTASLSPKDWTIRMEEIKHTIHKELFSRKDYMNFHKDISTATASRDLKLAVDNKILTRTGDKNTTRYQFIF
jgi:Fic family protein